MTNESGRRISDHLANERTFLAWVRTSIGIMAFGFVVVKFSLFVRQISDLLGTRTAHQPRGYSAVVGIILVAAGVVTSMLAFLRYKKTERQINSNTGEHSSALLYVLTGFIFLISIVLIVYLIEIT